MTKFKIDTDVLTTSSNNMNKFSGELNNLSSVVSSFPINCDIDFSGAISSIVENITYSSNIMNASSKALMNVVEKHQDLQNKLKFEAILTKINSNNNQNISFDNQSENKNSNVSPSSAYIHSVSSSGSGYDSLTNKKHSNSSSTDFDVNINTNTSFISEYLSSLDVAGGNQIYQLTNTDKELLMAIVAAEANVESIDDCVLLVKNILKKCENIKSSNSDSFVFQADALNEFISYQDGTYKKYLGGNVPVNVKLAVELVLNSVQV